MLTTERNCFEDEASFPCDFSSIMDCGIVLEGATDPIQYPPAMISVEDREFKGLMYSESFYAEVHREPLPKSTPIHSFAIPVSKPVMNDPVGDLILHFSIFYEHVYLLAGYPPEAQPQLHELRLLGERIHKCLIARDGSLQMANVKRCEEAHMNITLSDGFIQVARDKAILRQKV